MKYKTLIGASILVAMLCAGCENGNVVLSDADRAAEKAKVKKRGEARKELFVECMKLAPNACARF